MSSTISLSNLTQDCLAKLQRSLELVLRTAETASAEGDHKVVLQAAREVSRIVTLMHKMSRAAEPSRPKAGLASPGPNPPAAPGRRQAGPKQAITEKLPRQRSSQGENGQAISSGNRLPELPCRPSLESPAPGLATPRPDSGDWLADLDAGRLSLDLLNAIGVGRPMASWPTSRP